ncbi:MAG: multidrug efflux MFS transporter [Chloroflexi bacterium]|nr:multidrug efflux MFS transporter [Chloroflexota bacterium]
MYWKRNLVVLCGAQLLTLVGFSLYTSFIPYYVQQMGTYSDEAALSWTAAIQTAGALAMMVAAPIWGSLADRYGRKMMLLRATGAATVVAFLMGQVQSPAQLLALRAVQGIFCGTSAAAMTLVATSTPDAVLGRALGVMQMVNYVSQAVGPFIGGLAADAYGYRAVFPISSALMLTSLVGIIFFVHEARERTGQPARRERVRLGRGMLRNLVGADALILIGALAGTSLAASTLSPVLSLYIKSLAPGSEHLATLAGALTSVASITASVAAFGIGYVGDRFGQKRALIVCTFGVAAVAIPQAFVSTATQLAILRAVHGIFVGGIMPTANALLAQATSKERRGSVLGLASGAQAGGRALGPTLGAGAAAAWGMGSTFLLNGAVFLVLSVLVGLFVRTAAKHAEPAPASVAGRAPAAVEER